MSKKRQEAAEAVVDAMSSMTAMEAKEYGRRCAIVEATLADLGATFAGEREQIWGSTDTGDAETNAIVACIDVLKHQPPDVQQRVVAYLEDRYDSMLVEE